MSASIQQVRLIEVQGDEGEFSDLLHTVGKLRLDDKSTDASVNWFSPDGPVDSVELTRKRVTKKDGKIIVDTRFGNRFIFKTIGEQ